MPRRAFRKPLLGVLALLLAFAPVGSYAHALQHAHLPAGHAFSAEADTAHGHHHHGAPPEAPECKFFGAHAPLGAAATVAGLPAAQPHRPLAPRVAESISRPGVTLVPYLSTGPPHSPVTA